MLAYLEEHAYVVSGFLIFMALALLTDGGKR